MKEERKQLKLRYMYYHLENMDNMELMAMCPDDHFDLAIVDPPYFNGPEKRRYYGGKVSSTGVKRQEYDPLEWNVPGEEYFKELFRVSKNQIIWGCNYYSDFIPSKGRIIWDKVNGKSSYSDAEIASCSLHDSVRIFPYMWNGMMQGKSIEEGRIAQGNKKLNEKRIHQTQKPVKLYEWLLSKYAKPGDKILDTHLGSGSIAIACLNAGLSLTACELDEGMYNKAMDRFNSYVDSNA